MKIPHTQFMRPLYSIFLKFWPTLSNVLVVYTGDLLPMSSCSMARFCEIQLSIIPSIKLPFYPIIPVWKCLVCFQSNCSKHAGYYYSNWETFAEKTPLYCVIIPNSSNFDLLCGRSCLPTPLAKFKGTCFENYAVSRTTRSLEIDMQNFQEVYVISNGLILLR